MNTDIEKYNCMTIGSTFASTTDFVFKGIVNVPHNRMENTTDIHPKFVETANSSLIIFSVNVVTVTKNFILQARNVFKGL
jgi:hypothetical protein